MPGSITVTGGSTGSQSGQRALVPFTVIGTQDIGETISSPLVLGDNTFTIPTGAVGVVIVPAGNEPSTTTWTLRTSANPSDVGLPLLVTQPAVYVFPSPAPTTIILHANAAQTQPVDLWFW